MALATGDRLGHYDILSLLGAGGMGEVYKARDVRLDRLVAIKVLPAEVASDADRLKRFEQEARAASSLNHPNIVAVYDVGAADAVPYIATELVEGKTLGQILAAGALPARKLLETAVQIASGIAAAHEAGIVHRDLKPGNLMITREGFVKILDFGLAKLAPPPVGAVTTGAPTATLETRPGEILGTVGYMSPEQASGELLDFRSDQFSFGSLLYEMTTGRRAFRGKTTIDTLAAILNSEPEPIARLQPAAPAPLRWIIERCLAKDPAERYQSTRDLVRELQALRDHLSEISGVMPAIRRAPARRGRIRALALLAALVAGALTLWLLQRGAADPALPDFRRLTFQTGIVGRALFVPNSNAIIYAATWEGARPSSFVCLPESPGLDRELESESQLPMAFSADGAQVLVLLGNGRSGIDIKGTLAWWPAQGGKPRPVLENAGWADWAENGHFLAVVRDTGPERVLEIRTEAGSVRTLFRTRGAMSWIRLSADEKRVAFIHHPSRFDDAGEVRVVATEGADSRALTEVFERCVGLDWNPVTGEIWFTAARASEFSSAVWAVSRSGRLRSLYALPEFFVLQQVSASGDRCLLIQSENRIRLVLHHRDEPPRDFSWLGFTMAMDLSPDERNVLFFDSGGTEKTAGLWLRPLDGGQAMPLGPGDDGRFSPDGRWVVAVTRAKGGPPQLELIPVGAGSTRQLTSSTANHWSPSFAGPDAILFVSTEGGTAQVWRMKVDGSQARALGAAGCEEPVASPSLTDFLCVGGDGKGALFVYPLAKGAGRKLYTLPGLGRFNSARWNGAGDKVFAVTGDRVFLTLDSRSGAVLREETLPLPGSGVYGKLYGTAFNADGTVQAYSVARSSSGLFLTAGIR